MSDSCDPVDCSPPGSSVHGISYDCHFLLQGIFLTQRLNLCLLHWQADSLPLSHQGSPKRVGADCILSSWCIGESGCADDGDPLRVAEMVVGTSCRCGKPRYTHPLAMILIFIFVYLFGSLGLSCSERDLPFVAAWQLLLEAYGDVVHWPGIEPRAAPPLPCPHPLEVQSLSHWTTSEVHTWHDFYFHRKCTTPGKVQQWHLLWTECVPSPSYFEILTPNVMVLGGGALGR